MHIGTCTACQMGDHSRHVRVIHAVPEGVIGGSICSCEGECEQSRDQRLWEFMERVYGLDDVSDLVDAAFHGTASKSSAPPSRHPSREKMMSERQTLWRCPEHGLIDDAWHGWTECEDDDTLIHLCTLCPRTRLWAEGELEGPFTLILASDLKTADRRFTRALDVVRGNLRPGDPGGTVILAALDRLEAERGD